MSLLQSLPKVKVSLGAYNDFSSYVQSITAEENWKPNFGPKFINPTFNTVLFVPGTKTPNGYTFGQQHTCKETFVRDIRGMFEGSGKYKDVHLMVVMNPQYFENAVKFIHAFENEVMNLKIKSTFEVIEGHQKSFLMHVVRRWARNPQLYYILATMFRMAHLYDEKKNAMDNFHNMYHTNHMNVLFRFGLGISNTLMQFYQAYPVIQKIGELGFEKSIKSSKHFTQAWFIDKFANTYTGGMAGVGIATLGDQIYKLNGQTLQPQTQASIKTNFSGFTDEFLNSFFKFPEAKPATR